MTRPQFDAFYLRGPMTPQNIVAELERLGKQHGTVDILAIIPVEFQADPTPPGRLMKFHTVNSIVVMRDHNQEESEQE